MADSEKTFAAVRLSRDAQLTPEAFEGKPFVDKEGEKIGTIKNVRWQDDYLIGDVMTPPSYVPVAMKLIEVDPAVTNLLPEKNPTGRGGHIE